MLNIIAALLIFCGCSAIGFLYAGRVKDRQRVLSDFKICFANLKMSIEFSSKPLPLALKECVHEGCGEEVKELFESVSERLLQNEFNASVWEDEIQRIRNKKGAFYQADAEDIKLILNFLRHLGMTDTDTQMKSFEMIIETLGRRIEEISPEVKSKAKIYKTTGILTGLMIIIVLL
jgi:stage III sporulation protein AB